MAPDRTESPGGIGKHEVRDSDPAARKTKYRDLSGLFGGRIDDALKSSLSRWEEFSGLVPDDADEVAADHYDLFGRIVFPNAGVFLDICGLAGRDFGEIATLRERSGFTPAVSDPPDSVAGLLALLEHLVSRELQCAATGLAAERQHWRSDQALLLGGHLLNWFPIFSCATERNGAALFAVAARTCLDLLLDHAADVGAACTPLLPEEGIDPLHDPRTGLREVAQWLIRPARSGFFLSRQDVVDIARAREMPLGFGDRSTIVVNLLRSAARFDAVEPVLDDIDQVRRAFSQYLDDVLGDRCHTEASLQSWKQRLNRAGSVIGRLAEAVRADESGA